MTYKQMAYLYDQFMSHAPYDDWVRFTEEMIETSNQEITRIVDLGCGTGEITTRLAKRGYEMVGVDYSEDMLTYAEHKASQSNVAIHWLNQDIRELSGLNDFDLAISYCDVINYITELEDVEQTFQNVYDLLNPGGMFLFDVHSLEHITENYLNETFAVVTDEASYIWFCTPGDEAGEMYHDLTFYYLNNGKYERFDEQHHQRTFSEKIYYEILRNSGFENIKMYMDFELKQKHSIENATRFFFSARRGSR